MSEEARRSPIASQLIGCQPSIRDQAQPKTATIEAVVKDTTRLGTETGRKRLSTSRRAPIRAAARTAQVHALMSPGRGWITSRTPAKPAITALQRRQRT